MLKNFFIKLLGYNKFLTFCRSLEESNELLQTNIGED